MNQPSSLIDRVISVVDVALRSVCVPEHRQAVRSSPADKFSEGQMNSKEKQHIAGLMRINHAGEVCAQALYQGQAITAKLPGLKKQMEEAALEEVDHLAWCERRLKELQSNTGVLNPLWYTGAFTIGMMAGLMGDHWSLGFIVETERQVTEHLQKHITLLPQEDKKTQAILHQMQLDESQHAEQALTAGAIELPFFIKQLMRFTAKFMTKTSYYF